MLYQFTLGNYRSFYKKRTLSLMAEGISEAPTDNIAVDGKQKVLKTLAIYGANSSGKSNLVKAISEMRLMVLKSNKLNDDENLRHFPFLFQVGANQEPTFFEIVFSNHTTVYRYGFEYNREKIVSEWLFEKKGRGEKLLFIRTNEGIDWDEKVFQEGNMPDSVNLNDNRLFLSLCNQLGGKVSKSIMSWFQNDLSVISGLTNQYYRTYTQRLFKEKDPKSDKALALFKDLQLGFNQLRVHEEPNVMFNGEVPSDLVEFFKGNEKRTVVDSSHNLYTKTGKVCGTVDIPFEEYESDGTQKLFDLSGPMFNVLSEGSTLVIDELDAKMHPLISQYLISIFNSPTKNPHNAQLVFTTHDTHLLSSHLLRRDQIWFTEKDQAEQTDLYNMMDIVLPDGTKPRNDSNYEKNYVAGRYGAVPYIIND